LSPLIYYEGTDAAEFLCAIDTTRYAFDTEFASSSTYFPKLALVQIATPAAIAIIDPLLQDPAVLSPLLASSATMVAHAASNDLSILRHYGLDLPRRVLDTQIAAQFLGHRVLSLADLVELTLGVPLDKTHQRRDWTTRPLPRAALDYAASDVRYLLEIANVLEEELHTTGKASWWYEESALALSPKPSVLEVMVSPRSSKITAQKKASLLAWRESVARTRDMPRRWVVNDETIFSWAKALPGELPMLSEGETSQLHAALKEATKLPTRLLKRRSSAQKDALGRLRIARDSLAADLKVDAPLLATSKDLEGLIDGQSTRLGQGWRREHVLGPLSAVLDKTRVTSP
jgi:ribonuclease D